MPMVNFFWEGNTESRDILDLVEAETRKKKKVQIISGVRKQISYRQLFKG
jgi:hypothetical protein